MLGAWDNRDMYIEVLEGGPEGTPEDRTVFKRNVKARV
jgi:hypothetical protein